MSLQTNQPELTEEHKRRFKRDGFLVIRDAFDEDPITRARDALWEAMPEDRDDPASWAKRDGDHDEILHRGSESDTASRFDDIEPFEELFRDVYDYAEPLVGEGVLAAPDERPAEYCLHGGHLMASREEGDPAVDHDGAIGPILQYPRNLPDPLEEPFDYRDGRHVDGGTGPYAVGTDVEYLPFTIACAVYFDEVVPRGGGFTVWPGSHRIVPQYFQEHPRRDYQEADHDVLEELHPCPAHEITGEPGTLVLWHHNIMHGAAPNFSDRVRMAGFQRIAREDIAEIGQDGLADTWLQYPAMADVEPTTHDDYDTRPG